jgi:hypothetical protein
MSRKSLLSLIVLVFVASFVSACGSSHKPALVISVQLAPPPPAALEVGLSTQLTAQTINDTAAAGVDWSVTCTSADCGSISPAHTASGGATTYTAPATVPTGGSVTVTAASTTDPTQSATATITINPLGNNGGLPMGSQYAFFVTGVDATGFYSAAGSFTSNGDGTLIDGGEEDYANINVSQIGDTLVAGTYNIGSDGRGTISFTAEAGGVPDTNIGVAGIQTFTVVATSDFVNSGTHLIIAEADGAATSSGSVDLQSAGDIAGGVIPQSSYVFTLNGQDLGTLAPTTFGGVAIADGAGNITGALDENDGGTATNGSDLTGATSSAIDVNGRGTITLASGQTFSFYMVKAEVLRVVETDAAFVAGGSFFGASTAASFDPTALTGSFVFLDNGQEAALGPIGFGGEFTTDGAGNITAGVDDANENGVLTSAATVTGTYAVPDPTMPRVVFTITGGNSGAIQNVIVYLTDPTLNLFDVNNSAASAAGLLMDSDPTANGVGFVMQQAPPSASTFSGNYGLNFQFLAETTDEIDVTGQGLSDGTSVFNGTGDVAALGAPDPNDPMAGTFAADPVNAGRLTLTEVFTTAGSIDFALYQVSSAQVIKVGVDAPAVGILISQ